MFVPEVVRRPACDPKNELKEAVVDFPALAPKHESAFSTYRHYRPWRLGVLGNIERTYAMLS